MTTLATQDNDLRIERNNLVLTINDSDNEIEQRLVQNLQTVLGEWFLDITLGIPYLEVVYEKGMPADIIEAAFKEAIISTPGVVSLLRFDPIELNIENRTLDISFSVLTTNQNELGVTL